MSDTDDNTRDEADGRRPYEAPRVLETAEFETLALGCVQQVGDFLCQIRAGGNPDNFGTS